jgi:hypothetical protein
MTLNAGGWSIAGGWTIAGGEDSIVVHQGVGKHLEFVERVRVLAGDHSKTMHEVAVQDEDHAVEEPRFELRPGGADVSCQPFRLAIAVTRCPYAATSPSTAALPLSNSSCV